MVKKIKGIRVHIESKLRSQDYTKRKKEIERVKYCLEAVMYHKGGKEKKNEVSECEKDETYRIKGEIVERG